MRIKNTDTKSNNCNIKLLNKSVSLSASFLITLSCFDRIYPLDGATGPNTGGQRII